MKKHTGGLTSYLNETTQEVAVKDFSIDTNKIVEIDVHDLEQNESNFYGLRSIASLAGMISTSGYIEPLAVKAMTNGKYKIIAGHRRHAAVLLLLEKGERINPKVPCVIRNFEANGCLSSEEIEMCCLIFSNSGQRQERTISEKLEEVYRLEPIARKVWEEEKAKANIEGNFRKFFAEEALNTSSSALQRLLSLEKLTPIARKAVDDGKITETAAAKLASISSEEQNAYLERLDAGEATGTIKDIPVPTPNHEERDAPIGRLSDSFGQDENTKDTCDKPKSESISVSPVENSFSAEKKREINEDQLVKEGQQKPFVKADTIPNFNDADTEADSWVLQSLHSMLELAIKMIAVEKSKGNEKAAAQWGVRRAKVALVMATIKN